VTERGSYSSTPMKIWIYRRRTAQRHFTCSFNFRPYFAFVEQPSTRMAFMHHRRIELVTVRSFLLRNQERKYFEAGNSIECLKICYLSRQSNLQSQLHTNRIDQKIIWVKFSADINGLSFPFLFIPCHFCIQPSLGWLRT
jgi:hypothetical protein